MEKKRIMVVEDEGITALSMLNSLKKMGYDVTSTVFSGEDAIKKAEEDMPDLVLMDIILRGEKDGIEAAGHIQARFNIPVVYVSAYADDGMLGRIKKTSPFGYVVKPFNDRELRVAVEIAIYKHEMENKLRDSERELRKHREQLAMLVEERTAELHLSSELLKEEISDRRQAEAEAVRASHLAALGELAAGVAHEINNPINGIINYAQLLLNNNNGDSTDRDIVRRIIKESDRIAGIVQNLLSFARENREKKHDVIIQEIISDSLALTETQLKRDGIRIDVNIPSLLPKVFAQPQQLEQVFLNIISNARYALNQKYTGEDKDKVLEILAGEILINNNSHIRIAFIDRGTGIPDEMLDKIVNPFFSTKPNNVGTGLGLSISHSIIKDHGGALLIDSAEGEYTKVMVDLPLNPPCTAIP